MPEAARVAYGALAQRFASGLSEAAPVVVLDHSAAADALRDCMWRAFRGERFYVRIIIQRDASVRVDSVAPSIVATFQSLDERRVALDQACSGTLQASGRNLSALPAYSPAALRLMQGALRLSDGLVASSEAERRRVEEMLQTQRPAVIAGSIDPHVPDPRSAGDRDAVVIWAPYLAGDVASSFAVALGDLHLPLLLVSASAPTKQINARWIPAAQGSDALARARLIVDANAYGCDTALALSRWNAPLISDIESGAHEVLENVRTYNRTRMYSLFEAAVSALGSAPARSRQATSGQNIEIRSNELLYDGPQATIVIPTLDRPVLLGYALESCRRQSYKNVETVVVVDGGPRLDALQEKFPEVRFIYMPKNDPVLSTNTAFAQARGKYITLLSDDDLFFPDHVAALVTALEISGAAVAHGDVLTAFLKGDDTSWMLYGFESNMSRALDPTSLLVANRIGATSAMVRRSCLPDGPFDETIPLYRDYALWLTLSSRSDFVHVERITSCYTIKNQGAGQQSTMWHDQAMAAYKAIYDRYPVAGRPRIEQQRMQMLESVRAGGTALSAEPEIQATPVPWPPF